MNLKKLERYLRVNLFGPGHCLIKIRIYRAAISQRFRNTDIEDQRIRERSTAWIFIMNFFSSVYTIIANSTDTYVGEARGGAVG